MGGWRGGEEVDRRAYKVKLQQTSKKSPAPSLHIIKAERSSQSAATTDIWQAACRQAACRQAVAGCQAQRERRSCRLSTIMCAALNLGATWLRSGRLKCLHLIWACSAVVLCADAAGLLCDCSQRHSIINPRVFHIS